MDISDMILISVDDHVVEPPDMFKNHLPKKRSDNIAWGAMWPGGALRPAASGHDVSIHSW